MPGKFEGCADERLGRALYNVTLDGGCDEELGDVEGFGWYGLVLSNNRKTAYIVSEDSQGFFNYQVYSTPRARTVWRDLEKEYEQFNTQDEEEEY